MSLTSGSRENNSGDNRSQKSSRSGSESGSLASSGTTTHRSQVRGGENMDIDSSPVSMLKSH